MAENPHALEKDIKGTFDKDLLTGKFFNSLSDRIVQLTGSFSTTDHATLPIYEKIVQQYYKKLESLGLTGFQVDTNINAGFRPIGITGFLDQVENELLFNFFGGENNAYIYSTTLVNLDYTGYAMRLQREYDYCQVDVKYDANGKVSLNSECVQVPSGGMMGGFGFGTGIIAGASDTLSGFIGIAEVLDNPMVSPGNTTHDINPAQYDVAIVRWYDQGGTVTDGSSDLTGTVWSGTTDLQLSNFAGGAYDYYLETVNQTNPWEIIYGQTGATSTNVIYPVYYREDSDTHSFFKQNIIAPRQFGANSPFGLRWCFLNAGSISDAKSWHIGKGASDIKYQGNSNDVITTGTTNKPMGVANWRIKKTGPGQNGPFDSSVDASWFNQQIEDRPLIRVGNEKTGAFVDGTYLPSALNDSELVGFEQDGNGSKLKSVASIPFKGQGTISIAYKLDSIPLGAETIFTIGNSPESYQASVLSNPTFAVFGSIAPGADQSTVIHFSGDATNTIIGDDFTRTTGFQHLVMTADADGTSYYIASGDSIAFDNTGFLGTGVLNVGFGTNTTNASDYQGFIPEIMIFDSDPKSDDNEKIRFTGGVHERFNTLD